MTTDADVIIALARKLEAQNPSTLEAENATLRRERDQLKADAMSDLINRHWLENQVLNREAERDFLRAQNAALRAGQGRWPEGDDSPAGEQVPRVIGAEEIRPEQIIAYWQEGVRPNPFCEVAHVRSVVRVDEESYRVTDAEGGFDILGGEGDDCTIVLLEDAPTSDADDDPAPRLTVHALNTAPVGSKVSTPNITWAKADDETWFTASAFGQQARTSEELHALVYANATLTHPEGDDDE